MPEEKYVLPRGPAGDIKSPPKATLSHPALRESADGPAVRKSRLVVIETVHFTSEINEPVTAETRSGYWVESDEQPYKRTVRVGRDWVLIELGWLAGRAVAEYCLSAAERTSAVEFAGVVVRFSPTEPENSDPPHLTVRAGRSARFSPDSPVWVQSVGPTGSLVSVTAFPA